MCRHSRNIWLVLAMVLSVADCSAQSLQQVLKKHYKAIGQDQIAKARTAVVKGVFTSMKRPGNFTLTLKQPSLLRNDGVFAATPLVTIIKGDKGYTSIGGQPLKEGGVSELKNQLKFYSINDPIYAAQQDGATIIYEGKDRRSQKDVYKLKAKYINGDSLFAFIDTRTDLLLLTITYQKQPDGKTARVDRTFSDFRKVGKGTLLPFLIDITSSIEQMEARYTVNIYEYNLNPVVDDKLFEVK